MEALNALGSPVRRRLLELIRSEPRSVAELAAELPEISRPAVSRHLRVLEEAQLVQHAATGARNIYSIRAAGFEHLRAYLESFWDEALPRYALVAENLESK